MVLHGPRRPRRKRLCQKQPTNTGAVVQPHTRLFVGPKIFLPESLAFAPDIGSPFESLDGRLAHWVATASQITAKIDVVVFEDGELVGPDQSQFEVEIQSQKMAADKIGQLRAVPRSRPYSNAQADRGSANGVYKARLQSRMQSRHRRRGREAGL